MESRQEFNVSVERARVREQATQPAISIVGLYIKRLERVKSLLRNKYDYCNYLLGEQRETGTLREAVTLLSGIATDLISDAVKLGNDCTAWEVFEYNLSKGVEPEENEETETEEDPFL